MMFSDRISFFNFLLFLKSYCFYGLFYWLYHMIYLLKMLKINQTLSLKIMTIDSILLIRMVINQKIISFSYK